MHLTRRESIVAMSLALGATACGNQALDASQKNIATNTYPWLTFARRSGSEFKIHSDELLQSIAKTGITGYEPIVETAESLNGLQERLEKHKLSMKSIYVNSVLHDKAKIDNSIKNVLSIASFAKKLGTEIIVTNPSPIRWGGQEDKSDPQLRLQAKSLDQLGKQLRGMNIQLAYHNHDAELRQGGREFHHMLTATDPENVKFCLDAHWIFRGCGNSEVAVLDALSNYQNRIVELHLRQSINGIWTESFAVQGDIDYLRIMSVLAKAGIHPHLVLEQAVEAKTTNRFNAKEAHRLGFRNLSKHLLESKKSVR